MPLPKKAGARAPVQDAISWLDAQVIENRVSRFPVDRPDVSRPDRSFRIEEVRLRKAVDTKVDPRPSARVDGARIRIGAVARKERPRCVRRIPVVDTEKGDVVAATESLAEIDQDVVLHSAGNTPGRPEIDHDDAALVVGEANRVAPIQGGELKSRSWLADRCRSDVGWIAGQAESEGSGSRSAGPRWQGSSRRGCALQMLLRRRPHGLAGPKRDDGVAAM